MIFIDYDQNRVVDHVGIIYREGGHDEVIHATGSSRQPDNTFPNINSGRSVVHERITWRSYWSDSSKFVGLGRISGR